MKKRIISLAILCALILLGAGGYFLSKDPLVSVVMPTYNRADLLPRSILSILTQTYKNIEFIIVDDGSTDHSVALIKSFQRMDPRIRLIENKENMGISVSRNKGQAAAKGKYIAIQDSDDISWPTRLEKEVDFLEKHPDVVAVNSIYDEVGKEGKYNNWVPPLRQDILMYFNNYFTHLAVIRKSFIDRHKIKYNTNYISSEDYDYWKQIISNGGKIRMLNEPLIRLRRHRTYQPEYYKAILKNRQQIKAEMLSLFGIFPQNTETASRCQILKQMIRINPSKKLVNQQALLFTYRQECQHPVLPRGSLYIKHQDWMDMLIPISNMPGNYYRETTKEIANQIYENKKVKTFQWENGKYETFYKQDGSYGLFPYLILDNSDWEEFTKSKPYLTY